MGQPLISVTQFVLEVVSSNPSAGSPLVISGTPPTGQVGGLYTFPFVASGGTTPYAFSISAGSLPPGLTLDPLTGIVSGTPALPPGTYSFTVTVTGGGTASVAASIIIYAAVVITLYGWKLYPEGSCEDTVPGVEIPKVDRAV